jgi:hypothetical protein
LITSLTGEAGSSFDLALTCSGSMSPKEITGFSGLLARSDTTAGLLTGGEAGLLTGGDEDSTSTTKGFLFLSVIMFAPLFRISHLLYPN